MTIFSINVFRRSLATVLFVLPMSLVTTACESDSLKPPVIEKPDELVWTLRLDKSAALLSTSDPYDTLTVTATPRNYRGEALLGLPKPQFVSLNPDAVAVSTDGMLVGVRPGESLVVATLVSGNLRSDDSMLVHVVEDPAPPAAATLSIHPIPPDSAKVAVCGDGQGCFTFFNMDSLVRLTDSAGMPYLYQSQVPVAMKVSDTTIADFLPRAPDGSSHRLIGKAVGSVDVYASATVFGVTVRDTLPVRLGWPLFGLFRIRPTSTGATTNYFVDPAMTLGVGAIVLFQSQSTNEPTDIVFDDTTGMAPTRALSWGSDLLKLVLRINCDVLHTYDCDATGNMLLAMPNGVGIRRFVVPGVYHYHSVQHGVSGQIVITEDAR